MNKLLESLSDLLKLDTSNMLTRAHLEDELKIVNPNDYREFMKIVFAIDRQFKKPIDIFTEAIEVYKDGLKSELFKEVPELAKTLEKKLIALFMQIENLFNHNHETYDKKIVERMESATKYIQQAKINANDFWTTKDIQVVEKIGLGRCYTVYNSSYEKLDGVIENVMKSLITQRFLIGSTKQLQGLNVKRITS